MSNFTYSNDHVPYFAYSDNPIGDVIGPLSSTDNALPKFDGTSGKILQNTGVIVDDSNNISGINSETLVPVVANPGGTSTLWINSSNSHLYLGSTDLQNTTGEYALISNYSTSYNITNARAGNRQDIVSSNAFLTNSLFATNTAGYIYYTGPSTITISYLLTVNYKFDATFDGIDTYFGLYFPSGATITNSTYAKISGLAYANLTNTVTVSGITDMIPGNNIGPYVLSYQSTSAVFTLYNSSLLLTVI